jgi:hypothetical protein
VLKNIWKRVLYGLQLAILYAILLASFGLPIWALGHPHEAGQFPTFLSRQWSRHGGE